MKLYSICVKVALWSTMCLNRYLGKLKQSINMCQYF